MEVAGQIYFALGMYHTLLMRNGNVVAARSKVWVCGPLDTGIASSSPAEGMDVSFMFIYCVEASATG
jgi:hypothetical protein